ncbi:UDP-N-acetylglucosamine 1-carboxyvinyltransferase [Sinosporangium album]|uniref:UDP-N-acetylglucosamine 1-carboxyvinyltransferase n=1 Tax=Sinosporangium album TaxID=504805 RepID=A0A1G7QKR1_9ACTN|nr:hypothetical protein [Sinosporangium album]SDF99068.1 UDP-N-acetylglucosamine 1-carboxyvinyltransferase [Sinosporangium album]
MLNSPSAPAAARGTHPDGGRSGAPPDYWDVLGGPPVPRPVLTMGGFKHLLVPCLAAACLSDHPWHIGNAPRIEDRRVLSAVLRHLGAAVEDRGPRVTVDASGLSGTHIPAHWSAAVHGGIYLLPALLAARGEVTSGLHGGCAIGGGAQGSRPLSHVASVLERFGAVCEADAGGFRAKCGPGGLRGTWIDLAGYARTEPATGTPTGPHYSGATKTALLAAVTARGTTVLRNPYPKPDALELARLLGQAGAQIEISPGRITVEGLGGPLGGADITLPSDLMEVVTFIAWAVHLRREVELVVERPDLLKAGLASELALLSEMGVPLEWDGPRLRVRPAERLRAVRVLASSHHVYSDAGPLFALMLLGADAPSRLTDDVWGDRFGYADGLRGMGARLTRDGNDLLIRPGPLRPAAGPLVATDLRAAATLLLAALGTETPQRVHGVTHLARGYEDLPAKLAALGARIDIDPRTDAHNDTPNGTGEAS